MGSRKRAHHQKKRQENHEKGDGARKRQLPLKTAAVKKLEIVLKCDTSGCVEAVISAITSFNLPGVEIKIISSGVGAINNSDIFMAETGSRLVIGFNVGIMPNLDHLVAEHNVEIRLYDIIYRLIEDLEGIAKSFIPQETSEEIIGSARVVALFKSNRKGIILGCEVLKGKLVLGHSFRVLSAMGPVYTGVIESLHIERDEVRDAQKGQQVGLKIKDFNKVKIGDLVESFQALPGQYARSWQPQGKIYYPTG